MKQRGKLQTNLEYLAVRAIVGGLGSLPRSLGIATGRGCGWLAYHLAGGLRRTGRRNLKLAFPDLSQAEQERLLRGCFDSLGRQLGEFSRLPAATPDKLRSIIKYAPEDAENIEILRQQTRGVIFLTCHLGAWELLSFAHAAFGEPLSFLVRPLDNSKLDAYVTGIRNRFGNQAIDKKAAARTAYKVLKNGGRLGILADLNTQEREGVFVPFFGHLACTTSGAAWLALKTDALVMPVCSVWSDTEQKFIFRSLSPLELIRTGDDAHDIQANTANFTAAIEKLIRRYPEQWMWIHNRWKTRPAGEPSL